jgi:hypothetical protein
MCVGLSCVNVSREQWQGKDPLPIASITFYL